MAPPATKNFRQSQPITTGLRIVCESYPANTCLRELLQNADDAGATEIEYVLDTKTYTSNPLLYEALQEYHGPALLARNDSVFTDEDFSSLSSVGDSRKRNDATTTGKFGLGFNSVSHDMEPRALDLGLETNHCLRRFTTGQTARGYTPATGSCCLIPMSGGLAIQKVVGGRHGMSLRTGTALSCRITYRLFKLLTLIRLKPCNKQLFEFHYAQQARQ